MIEEQIEDLISEFLEDPLMNFEFEHEYVEEQKEELIDSLRYLFKTIKIENIDMKKYIIDTNEFGIDKETLEVRAERYREQLTKN